jgi:hypothetical protein
MPTKKAKINKNGNGKSRKYDDEKLPTQKDIAASLKGKKMTKEEKAFVEASVKVIEMMDRMEKEGFVW